MNDRKTLLKIIFDLEHPERLDELGAALRQAGWDSPEEELINLTGDYVIFILRRYLARELTEQQVEDWANLVECREDITFGLHDDEETVMEAIHDLANPVLEGKLTPESAKVLIRRLEACGK